MAERYHRNLRDLFRDAAGPARLLNTQMTLASLQIDLTTGEGAELIQAIRQTDPALADASWLIDRAYLLRSSWAPGFRFVGARAVHDGFAFNVGGGSLTVDRAMMSCLGEAAERLSQVERREDVLLPSACDQLPILPATRQFCELIAPAIDNEEIDWVGCQDVRGHPGRIPADWCLRRATDGKLRMPGTVLSTGCAAGRTNREATVRGLLELVERDAAALWWSGARQPRKLDDEVHLTRLLGDLRGGGGTRRTWFLDISSDIAIPAVAALSCDWNGKHLAIGMAARCDLKDASSAALLELCQMELGLQLAWLKAREGDALTDDDQRHIARSRIDFATDLRFIRPLSPRFQKSQSDEDELTEIVSALRTQHIEAMIVNLSRLDIGVATIKAVAPNLQPLPSTFVTPRMKAAAASSHFIWPPTIPLH